MNDQKWFFHDDGHDDDDDDDDDNDAFQAEADADALHSIKLEGFTCSSVTHNQVVLRPWMLCLEKCTFLRKVQFVVQWFSG